jgi:hypothetical protein
MYDDRRDQATAGTAGPRRRLRKLLLLVRSSAPTPPSLLGLIDVIVLLEYGDDPGHGCPFRPLDAPLHSNRISLSRPKP